MFLFLLKCNRRLYVSAWNNAPYKCLWCMDTVWTLFSHMEKLTSTVTRADVWYFPSFTDTLKRWMPVKKSDSPVKSPLSEEQGKGNRKGIKEEKGAGWLGVWTLYGHCMDTVWTLVYGAEMGTFYHICREGRYVVCRKRIRFSYSRF